jgi:hypothetical protein
MFPQIINKTIGAGGKTNMPFCSKTICLFFILVIDNVDEHKILFKSIDQADEIIESMFIN